MNQIQEIIKTSPEDYHWYEEDVIKRQWKEDKFKDQDYEVIYDQSYDQNFEELKAE